MERTEMHVNVWAEDLEKNRVKLVTKKGYVGLQVSLDETGQNQLTFWGKDQTELAAVLALWSTMAEKGVVFE